MGASAELLEHSIATPSLVAAVMNAKYTNALPLYRIAQEMERYSVKIPVPTLANWVIRCSERYFYPIVDRMQQELCKLSVLQVDETVCKVSKDGRPANAESRMFAYRSGEYERERIIVLFDYQKTRNAELAARFLNGFSGILVSHAFSGYHALDRSSEAIQVANCWAHARRGYSDALKALPKKGGPSRKTIKNSIAYQALERISSLFALEELWKDLQPEERYRRVNQEKYLRVFLTNSAVQIDNSACERAIRPFCVGRANWRLIDTIHGAGASAAVYSIVETAKANRLKPYEYLNFLLTEMPKHMNAKDNSFLDKLLPWSKDVPAICRKNS